MKRLLLMLSLLLVSAFPGLTSHAQSTLGAKSAFGVESNRPILPGSSLFTRAASLGVGWVRLNDRISWRKLQPLPDSPIAWESLSDFERELRALRTLGAKPIVVVDDYPLWATLGRAGADGKPSHCDALKDEAFEAFGRFLARLVARYAVPEFNVQDWELGNEPDVDPRFVPSTSQFGCWGDISDPFYGGERYGRMLKVVAPMVRAANPRARIWIGGLLLNSPGVDEGEGKGSPGRFFEGILRSGAADSFDVVAFHAYLGYAEDAQGKPVNVDYDHAFGTSPQIAWSQLGESSLVAAKAAFLRRVMQNYGVSKPLFLNEGGFHCRLASCEAPSSPFYDVQANAVVHAGVRVLSAGVSGYIWYTLEGPGWRNGGLLDRAQRPRPAFYAYRFLSTQLGNARFLGKSLESNVARYRFQQRSRLVEAVWSVDGVQRTLRIPTRLYSGAVDREGEPLALRREGGDFVLEVSARPVYLLGVLR